MVLQNWKTSSLIFFKQIETSEAIKMEKKMLNEE